VGIPYRIGVHKIRIILKLNIQKRFSFLDYLLLAVVLLLAIFIIYRIKVSLNYKWKWESVFQYVIRRDAVTGKYLPGLILYGFSITIKLAVWSTFFALIIGIIAGSIRSGKGAASKFTGFFYIQLVRNIPPIVLVFIFYFFVGNYIIAFTGIETAVYNSPQFIKKIISFLFINPARFPEFLSAIITMAVYEGAYITEIIKAGINSVNKGELEAARALGLNRSQTLRHIVLPQAIRFTLPPLAGQFISCIKDCAIISVISIPELTFQGLEIISATYLTFEVWIIISFLYFILTFSCSFVFERIFSYSKR
jgi:polar amino acid transport system permease protein